MTMYSSKSTQGFYDDGIHTPDQIPKDAVVITREQHTAYMEGQSAGKMINFDTDGIPVLIDRPRVWITSAQAVEQLNNAVASTLNKWVRFESEYLARESAAKAYKEAGYKGDVSIWISSFSDATGIEPKEATDLILSQAVKMRAAQETLGTIRMQKYKFAKLKEQALEDLYLSLLSQVKEIDDSLE